MTRILLALTVAGLALHTVHAQQAPAFSSRTDLVVVPAVVVNGKGRPVADLAAADFELREDGDVHPITTFTYVDADAETAGDVPDTPENGRFVVLVLDDFRVPLTSGWRVKEIAERFVKLMRPQDTVTVIRLNGDHGVTSNRQGPLRQHIKRYVPFGEELESLARDASFSLRTLASLTQQMQASPHRRKVMVWIGAPVLFSSFSADAGIEGFSRGTPPEYSVFWRDAVGASGRNNVSVYVIDPILPREDGFRGTGANGFADGTGGQSFISSSNMERVVNSVWQDAGSYYLLGYAAPSTDGKLHKLEVRVTRPGVQVRARKLRG